jgi:hypothetical protein
LVDGTTFVVPTAPTASVSIDSNGKTYVMVGTQPITPGGPPVILSGTTYSLAPSGNALVIDSTTSILQASAALGLSVSTGSSGNAYVMVGTQRITPGVSAVFISGTTYSVASSGWAIAIDGITEYVLGSQTLVAGGAPLTISGTVVSLELGGQSVVVAGSTEAMAAFWKQNTGLAGPIATSSAGLGGIIATLGGFATPTSTSVGYTGPMVGEYNGTVFLGSAVNNQNNVLLAGCLLGFASLAVLFL